MKNGREGNLGRGAMDFLDEGAIYSVELRGGRGRG